MYNTSGVSTNTTRVGSHTRSIAQSRTDTSGEVYWEYNYVVLGDVSVYGNGSGSYNSEFAGRMYVVYPDRVQDMVPCVYEALGTVGKSNVTHNSWVSVNCEGTWSGRPYILYNSGISLPWLRSAVYGSHAWTYSHELIFGHNSYEEVCGNVLSTGTELINMMVP